MKNISVKWMFAIGLIALAYTLVVEFSVSPLNTFVEGDQAVFMAMGRGWIDGCVPYRDLFDHKGPVVYLINALGQLISGGKVGMYLLSSLNLSAFIVLLVKIAGMLQFRKSSVITGVILTLVIGVSTIGGGNMTEEWSILFETAVLYMFIRHITEEKEEIPLRYIIFCGICFGIIAMIRINNACIIASVIAVMGIELMGKKKFRQLAVWGILFVTGCAIVIVPLLAYFYSQDALDEMIFANFGFNMTYRHHFVEITPKLMYKNFIRMVPLLCLGIILFWHDKEKYRLFPLFSIISAVVFTYVFIASAGYYHYYTSLLPLFFLYFTWMMNTDWRKWIKVAVVVLCLFPYSGNALSNFRKSMAYCKGEVVLNGKPIVSGDVDKYLKAIQQLPVGERDSIAMFQDFGYQNFFIYTETLPCMKYFYVNEYYGEMSEKIGKETQDFYTNTPPLWLLYDGTAESKVMVDVLRKYDTVLDIDGTLKLYKRHENTLSVY